jgi:arginine decarboxylase
VLITDVIDIEQAPTMDKAVTIKASCPQILQEMWQAKMRLTPRLALEVYHDAMHLFSEAHQQYVHGLLSITDWSQIEILYFEILRSVRELLEPSARSHREIIDDLNEKLADKLFVNFSLFQSMPDVWGIDQLFPIMPIERLNEPCVQRAIIQDITCDSDGQIREYVDGAGIEASLPIPAYNPSEQYCLAMFMVGAYQEILGDLHNLFGDTDSVHVELTDDGFSLTNALKGDSVSDVLKYVHYSEHALKENYQQRLAQAPLSNELQATYLVELENGLSGYTYFED